VLEVVRPARPRAPDSRFPYDAAVQKERAMLAKELRTPRERKLFALSAMISTVVWLAMLISIIGIPYAILVGVVGLVVHCLFMAHVIGNGVRVGPRQLPELQRRIEAAAHKLGLDRVPEAYVLQSGGLINAFATKLLSRRFIIIYSDLLEACDDQRAEGSGRPNELDFVIAHELGHVAAGHLATRLFLLPARLVPLLGAAYARACEYTCDRCGHAVVEDLAVSSRALAILAAGPQTARRMDLDAYVEQRRETRNFWMAVYELNASHPFLSKRVAALRNWQVQGAAAPVGRNPFAYPLAPFLGLASGGASSVFLIVVIFVGVAAAVAIPRIKQQMGLGAAGLLPPRHDSFYDQGKEPADLLTPPPDPAR
jgi:Zn-dependent protease with chaperone function